MLSQSILLVYRGILWYTTVNQKHDIPCFTMVHHGTPWCTMVYLQKLLRFPGYADTAEYIAPWCDHVVLPPGRTTVCRGRLLPSGVPW